MLLSPGFWGPILTFSTCALLSLLLITFIKIARSALSSPLNTIPGPYVNRWTDIPLILAVLRRRKLQYVHTLHQKYGPYFRTAPNEISVSNITSVKAIHNVRKGYEKSDFYKNLQRASTLVCLTDNKIHAARRHFAGTFSRQGLSEWEGAILGSVRNAINVVKVQGANANEVDLLSAFSGMAEEVIGELCFGEAFKGENIDEISSPEKDPKREAMIYSIRTELLVPGSDFERNLPVYLKYIPRPILSWVLRGIFDNSVCETLRRDDLIQKTERKHTLLYKALAQNEKWVGLSDETIAMEVKAFIIAGTDTTAITSYLVWAVLRHPKVQARLLEEVRSLPDDFSVSHAQKLPYVQMVVSITLHRNPEVFEKPLEFIPERWEHSTSEMREAFMPFGTGVQACIGPHLAQIEIALAATIFFRECPHAQVAPSMRDDDMEPSDLFIVGPRGQKLNEKPAPLLPIPANFRPIAPNGQQRPVALRPQNRRRHVPKARYPHQNPSMFPSSPNLRKSVKLMNSPQDSKVVKTMPELSYRPLTTGQFRLLTLLPGAEATPIQTALQHVNLEDKPTFDALSYEWGPESANTSDIFVNKEPFTIRHNLWLFLKRLRAFSRSAQVIYADAICL
ncbi:cytochrome P450 [Rhexocercosporidium sp. MPI-PUGE-AT-0058]|nr:cytochrome P450 [Rhexocercosporidium sp. MPI-PUGE-AT-0058]